MKPFEIADFQLDEPSNIPVPKLRSLLRTSDTYTFISSDLCGTILLLGLSDGSVCQYHIDQDVGVLTLRSFISNAPIRSVSIVPSESKCLALSDGYLYVLDMELSVILSVRCTAYYIDCQHQSPCRITVSDGTLIQEYSLGDELLPTKKYPSESALSINRLKSTCLLALETRYMLHDLKSNSKIELFPFEGSPCVEIVGNDYLIVTKSAQGFGIGIFISRRGDPVRVFPIDVGNLAMAVNSNLNSAQGSIHC